MIKLISTYAGADLEIKNGKISRDYTLNTPIILSLTGGNVEADTQSQRNPAGVDNLDWFGNLFMISQGQPLFNSKFERATRTLALMSGNLKEFERAANEDLDWMIQKKIAEKVEAVCSIVGTSQLKTMIYIYRSDKTKQDYQYLFEV